MATQLTPKDPPPVIALEKAPYLNVTYAQGRHLKSLETVFQRAFHPNNAFHRRVNPDTPMMRSWWRKMHEQAINDPASRVIIVEDTRPNVDEGLLVVGICRVRLMGAQERGAGVWDVENFCADQSVKEMSALVEMQARWREESCLGSEHYMIELLGNDASTQGTGGGLAMVGHVCQLADERGVIVFVQANGNAASFYEKHGFYVEHTEWVENEGGEPYKEVKMLRQPKKA